MRGGGEGENRCGKGGERGSLFSLHMDQRVVDKLFVGKCRKFWV